MDELPDPVLPTYALLARFRVEADSPDAAVRLAVAALTLAQEPFHEVAVERDDGAGVYFVVARFVLASVDGETVLAGLYATLREAALAPDEVWLDAQVA